MKPKIADIEGCHRILSEGDDPSTTILITMTECAALLRIARAAKEYSDAMLMANDEEDMDTKYHLEDRAEVLWDEMQKELDAFDWGDE